MNPTTRQASLPKKCTSDAVWHVLNKSTKMLQVNLPDQVARDVDNAVKTGKFQTADEVILAALRESISRRRYELQEEQQLNDVAWALR